MGTETELDGELEQLIAEQARDAADFRVHSISVDAWPSGADAPAARAVASDDRHGELSCYTILRCRCTKCRRANADYQREWKRRRRLTRPRAERDRAA